MADWTPPDSDPTSPAPASSAYDYYQRTGAIPIGSPPDPPGWDQVRDKIIQRESGGKNVPNYRYDATHTAGGFFQITDTNWNAYAPKLGIDVKQYPDALSAPADVQEQVAKQLYADHGLKPWAESMGGGGPVISAGKWNVSPDAIQYEQDQGSDVRHMSPADYLALTPPIPPSESQSAKARSLDRSLAAGDDIEAIPTLDVKPQGKKLVVYDQDGRNRALAAQQAGVDLIPVAVRGGTPDATEIQGITGTTRPFDWQPVGDPRQAQPPGSAQPPSAVSDLNPMNWLIPSAQAAERVAHPGWQPPTTDAPTAWAPPQGAGAPESEAVSEAGTNRALFGAGLESLPVGVAQLGAHLLPQSALDLVSSINSKLSALEGAAPPPAINPAEIDREAGQFGARTAALSAQPHAWGTYGAGQMAAGAPLVGSAAALAPAAGSLLARAGIGAGIGALASGTMPVTGSSFGPAKAEQLASGALLGGIAAPLTDAIKPLAGWAARLVGLGKPTAAADAIISRIAKSPAGPTAQDMMDIAAASAKPLTLADMSRRLASLAGRVSRAPGPASDIVAQNLGARASARGARVYSDVAGEFGGGDLHEATTALSAARSAAAKPLFEAALQPGSTAPVEQTLRKFASDAFTDYQNADRELAAFADNPGSNEEMDAARERVVDAEARLRQISKAVDDVSAAKQAGVRGAVWSPRLARLLENPEMRSGIATGLRTLRNEADARGQPFISRDYAITGADSDGNPIVSKVPNMRLLQAAKIGLEAKVEAYRNPVTRQLMLDHLGRSQQELLRALTKELHDLNPAYAKADLAWSGPSRQHDAAQWGAKILNMDKGAVRDRMARFSPDEQEFARLGVGSMLRDYLARKDASPSRIGSLLSDLYRQRLAPMFRSPDDFDRFTAALRDERTMAQTDTRVLGNSLTAERQAEDQGPMVHHAGMLGIHAVHHNLPGVLINATRLASNMLRASSPETDAAIAHLLTTPLSQGSDGMALLGKAAAVLPNIRRLYLGRYAAGGAGLLSGGRQ